MPDAPPPLRRVVFLNRFYWPEESATAQLLTELAEALAARGHEVCVIASHPGPAGLPRSEAHHQVRIARVRGTRWGRHSLAGRAVDFATFSLGALWRLGCIARKNDAVVVLTDPPLLGIFAWLVARARRAGIFHWVQDIYPEIAIVLTGHGWLRVWRPLRNLAWRRSDGCATLGTDMISVLAAAGVPAGKITLVPNWAPTGLAPQPASAADQLRLEWNLAGKFVVAYSGNLGRVHDLDTVLDVANALRDEPDLVFIFIGSGAQRSSLEAKAAARSLANVRFFPPQPRARLAVSLALGDIHLVTLLPGCERFIFPSKLYGVAAIGRPVIFIGPRDCELSRLVAQRGFGHAFEQNEAAGIAASIRQWRTEPARLSQLGNAAGEFGRAHCGPDAAAAAWTKLLSPGA